MGFSSLLPGSSSGILPSPRESRPCLAQGPACLYTLSWVSRARGQVPSAVHLLSLYLLCLHLLNSVYVHWGLTLD